MKISKIITSVIMLISFFILDAKEIRVLQFNIWQEGTVVKGGYEAIIDEILQVNADLIALSEVRNYNGTNLADRLVKAMKKRGYTYYSIKSQDSGILSKYPILSQMELYPVKNDHGSITKAMINVDGKKVAFYSGHLDYLNCALYLPRGYCGNTWKELESPVTDISEIHKMNLTSMRDEAINAFITDSKEEIAEGNIVILGMDLNEPSHLDWVEQNAHMYDHNGVEIMWDNTYNLEKSGFKDVYREKYPNPVTHPGFTYPANNPLVPLKKLAWSPNADDRDRIDFIFYYPDKRLKLKSTSIHGPKGSIAYNKRVVEKTQDKFILPKNIWPTDHKAVLAVFEIK